METIIKELPVITTEVVHCTYCSELAIGVNNAGMPVCGIPDNHPDEDTDVAE